MKKLIGLALAISAAMAGAVEVTSVSAKQRWPWNNLVDVDFTLSAPAGEAYRIELEAKCADGTKYFSAKTLTTDPVVAAGENRMTWDFGADYPGIRAEDMQFAVTAVPVADDDKPLYLVIDLSGGVAAKRFPVRYTSVAPQHTIGAVGEKCQTTELWLRRITVPKSAFGVLYYKTEGYAGDCFYAKLTQDYYMGIFELTQKQYELISGATPAHFKHPDYKDSRPVETLAFNTMTGTWEDPVANPHLIGNTSPLGVLRAKTGLPINLQTLAQWQYAVLGGAPLGTEIYRYKVNGETKTVGELSRYSGNVETTSLNDGASIDNKSGTAVVGSYLPNDYGLYDMLGNVWELVSSPNLKGKWKDYYPARFGDATLGQTAANPVINPLGCAVSEATAENSRLLVGGSYASDSTATTVWSKGDKTSAASWQNWDVGFRLVMTVQ